MINSKKNLIIIGCTAISLFFIFKSIFSNDFIEKSNHTLNQQEHSQQFKVAKDSSNKKALHKKRALKAQAKFRVNNNKNSQLSLSHLNSSKNVAQAPTQSSHKAITNGIPSANGKTAQKDVKSDEKKKEEDVAKKEKESEEEKKKKKEKEEIAKKLLEEDLNRREELNRLESKDLALQNLSQVEDIVTYTTTTFPQTADQSNDDDNNNSSSDDDEPKNPTAFTFDPTTTTVIETLLERKDFTSIDSLLRDNNIDKRTAYFELVEYASNNPGDSNEITSILGTHFFNIDSTNILTSHLTSDETTLEEKQISYGYLLQLVNSWPAEEGSAQQFNAVFVEGVNEQLSGESGGTLTPQEELYLQLSNSIFIKLDEINSVQA